MRGHWIWYVFPQIDGLGLSLASQEYAIAGVAEAAEYLEDSELRSNFLEIALALVEQLRGGMSLRRVMGSDIDARKLVSSLTLFGVERGVAGPGTEQLGAIAEVADEILGLAAAQGCPPCALAVQRVKDAN